MTALLQATAVTVHYGHTVALDGVDIAVAPGRVTGLIGANGAGKTTLVDALMGYLKLTGGRVSLDGRDLDGVPPHRRVALGMTRTFQGVELFDDLTVAENLKVAAESSAATGRPSPAHVDPAAGASELARDLSPSARKSVALARALATHPRVLLLDEPAAGLDPAERTRLVETVRSIAAGGTAVLLIDHDLAVVTQACDDLVVLDRGRVVVSGGVEEVREDPRVHALYLGHRIPAPSRPSPAGARGDAVVMIRGLCASYGAGPVITDLAIDVAAGEVVALLGANGAGKTTTLMALSGAVPGTSGTGSIVGRPLGTAAHVLAKSGVTHVSQTGKVFGSLTARENLRLGARSADAIEAALDLFPAVRPLLHRPADALSGGEQQLLALARAVARRPRLLLIDELSHGLPPAAVADAFDALGRVRAETSTALVFAEQRVQQALDVADRAYVLAAGRVVLAGSAHELAGNPDRLTAAYLGESVGG